MTNSLEVLKAAAEKATPGQWQAFIDNASSTFSVFTKKVDDVIGWMGFDGRKNAANNAIFIALASPENIKALMAALERLKLDADELRDGFIANQEEACEAIKYATELKEKLTRSLSCREEAIRELDEIQKSLDHTHKRRALWRARAEAAEKRIAELEAAAVKPVKLPTLANIHSNWRGEYMLKSDVIEAILAAGGSVVGGD
jgi:hypothetical protein